MQWKVITAGKASFPWVREGVETYLRRLRPWTRVEWIELRHSAAADYLRAAGGARLLLLEERGAHFTTAELRDRVDAWERESSREVAVLIGGADGLDPALPAEATRLCLGRQTLMHELALLVWMEQLYRVYTLKHGHPYHREG